MIKDFINLIYPDPCVLCGTELSSSETKICVGCDLRLPKTLYSDFPQNPIFTSLNARTGIAYASSFLFFQKGNRVQKLLYELKYRGDQTLGHELGRRFGSQLVKQPTLQDVDLVLPVPLHPTKQLKRGFNQSLVIADGLSQATGFKLDGNQLVRKVHGSSQTRKSRYNRWKNVDEVFGLTSKDYLLNKHILILDDVFTTGATLEACIKTCQKASPRKISVVTLACAD